MDGVPADVIEASMDRSVAQMRAASAQLLRDVVRFDDRRLWEREGHTSMTPWLADRYQETWGVAREWVRVAHAVRELPAIFQAYAEGRLSWCQLQAITKVATPGTDETWARSGPEMPPSRLWLEVRRQERQRRLDAERDHGLRMLWMRWDEERRFLRVAGELPGEQGEAFERSVRDRAKDIAPDEEAADPGAARLADAVSELVTRAGDRPAPSTLVVHADVDAVLDAGSDGRLTRGETASGVQLADETVRRIGCDARIEWHLEREGGLVGIGVQGRQVPGWMMRALDHRDRGCRFPGCGRTMYVHAHHIEHWAQGGKTELRNLVLLCSSHHRLVHERRWTIRGDPERELRFHDPTGAPLGAASYRSPPVAA